MNPAITPELSRSVLPGSFPGDLGFEITALAEGEARGRMVVDRRHLHPGGYVHGGAWTAFADTVAAWGTMRHLAPEQGFTTIELKLNVFAAGREGDVIEAVGTPLHAGGRTQVWEVRMHKGERLVANFVCTQMIL